MSWDIWAEIDTGNDYGMHHVTRSINYTHNCNHMIRDAGFEDWCQEIHGVPVLEFCKKLRKAIDVLEENKEKYEAMNPDNGWGNYTTLLPKLRILHDRLIVHPKATIGASF